MKKCRTKYTSDEFLQDYRFFAERSVMLVGATPVRAAAFTEALFLKRYEAHPHAARKRMDSFLKVMSVIEANHVKLITTGYLEQPLGAACARVSHDLIRALHRLIIEERNEKPTFDEIKQVSDFFNTRN